MIHRSQISRAMLIGFFGGALLLSASGCPDDREKTSVQEVVGTVEEIDLVNRKVKVRAYLEKHETYQTFDIQVTDDTEVLINGALAKMEDVRVGERAEGRIRVVRRDGKTMLTALAVNIERGEVLSAPDAEQPTNTATSGDNETDDTTP